MHLSEYLSQTGIKPSALAEKAAVAPSTVSRILNRERSMSLEMAVKLARATGGCVTIDDIIAEFADVPVTPSIPHDAPAPAVDPSRPTEACALQSGEAPRPPGASPDARHVPGAPGTDLAFSPFDRATGTIDAGAPGSKPSEAA